jgi:hypothetical protein
MDMRDMQHTNPYTKEPFGKKLYDRDTVAADGGREPATETLGDIDHEAPTGGATRSFERGNEGRDETV